MSELLNAATLLLVLLGSAALGLLLRPLLSERHTTRETFELIQIVTTMLVTFAALVLGLLTSSAKTSFDRAGNDLQALGSDLIQVDQCLRDYGPGANTARALLRRYTAAAIADTWPTEPAPEGDDYPRHLPPSEGNGHMESATLGAMLDQVGRMLRGLEPAAVTQQRLAADCRYQFQRLDERRWKLIEDASTTISLPFYLVLVFWLVVVFASFGLSAPRNPIAFVMLGLGAVSIASAIYVILDLDTPFLGLFSLSSEPLRHALAQLRR
ncbi:bestrophin-like domain [Rhodopila globiformis]|uniref:DUF4239 domain-containing protein n=1 Tax=Rhodopila globiformis TaxID=1071 RepID=A0A2S6N784_RHOGL|nr:DUF4239 domain-containing protein [Rhodopila globiformis]PPQ30482.1 hypothetical protein CCS01_19195 [Rhodopila globiformis]